jgi:hypothetical protein
MKLNSAGTIGLAALLLCSFACLVQAGYEAPPVESPAAWPQTFGERTLYQSDHAFVYAASKSAARQAKALLADVAAEVDQDGAAGTTAGLVLVVDVKEKLPFDVNDLLDAMAKAQPRDANEPPDKRAKDLADAKGKLQELGLNMETVLCMMPIPIKPAALREIAGELPKDLDRQITWCLVVPTSKCTKAAFKKMIAVVMKKEKLGLAKRTAVAAMMPIIERKIVSQLKKVQQAMLFELLLEPRQDLSPDQKKQKLAAYKHKLGLDEDLKIDESDKDKESPPPPEDE